MKKELLQLVDQLVDKEKYFTIDIHINQLKGTWMIKLVIDSDAGVGIDECTEISRLISKSIDDLKITEDYEIEVSSPGVGEPLKFERQYIKNIGRLVKISTSEGKYLEGKLLKVESGSCVVIEEQKKVKHKTVSVQQTEIPFTDIKKTIVLISFN